MPTYSYLCENCDYHFELFATISQYKEKPKCSKCNKRCVRDYHSDLANQNIAIKKSDSELKTIGDLAKRNSERLSSDEKAYLSQKHNSYKSEGYTQLPTGMSRIKKGKK